MTLQNKSKSKLDSCSSSELMFHPVVQRTCFDAIGPSTTTQNIENFSVFVATWNVGGKCPDRALNLNLDLDRILHIHDPSDIYVLGFQEIVPLNAGNVLVIEDNEPAVNWLALINQSLNRSSNVVSKSSKAILSGSIFFPKPSLKRISKVFKEESGRKLKACNCIPELERKNSRDLCFRCQQPNTNDVDFSSDEEDDDPSNINIEISDISIANQRKYSLITSKQMVGIFLTIWMRTELVQYVSHLRVSYVSRGIMGCLGNKGCISVSMCFHQTSFCFICSHLASGEKEGDELRRNLDVIEILKNTQFKKICRMPRSKMPVKILDHDRVIWLGDLNYRIALSYAETKKFMEMNDRDTLFSKDQLKIERDAGRVFEGWKEGKIYFDPTYKYSCNSDAYTGETKKSRNKRRTPAWCDRILWHGNGIHQQFYDREESQFSDHRPVYSEFWVNVLVSRTGSKRLISSPSMRVGAEELLPPIGTHTLIKTIMKMKKEQILAHQVGQIINRLSYAIVYNLAN